MSVSESEVKLRKMVKTAKAPIAARKQSRLLGLKGGILLPLQSNSGAWDDASAVDKVAHGASQTQGPWALLHIFPWLTAATRRK